MNTAPKPRPDPSDPVGTFSYRTVLAERVKGEAKGQRTAQQIRIATCALLEDAALQDLTISGICKQAGVANGTFYLYFQDQSQLLDDLLPGFAHFLQDGMMCASRGAPDDSIRAATRAYAMLFRENRGLMKCLVHHLDRFPEARGAFHRLNRDWIETVATAARRRMERDGVALPEDDLMRRAYALGAMTDQYFSGLFLSGEPGLVAVSGDLEAVVDTLTTIWERGLRP